MRGPASSSTTFPRKSVPLSRAPYSSHASAELESTVASPHEWDPVRESWRRHAAGGGGGTSALTDGPEARGATGDGGSSAGSADGLGGGSELGGASAADEAAAGAPSGEEGGTGAACACATADERETAPTTSPRTTRGCTRPARTGKRIVPTSSSMRLKEHNSG